MYQNWSENHSGTKEKNSRLRYSPEFGAAHCRWWRRPVTAHFHVKRGMDWLGGMGAVPVIALIVMGRQGNGQERLRCGFWMVGMGWYR